jgi:putative exosortase-associated protein (TIGR04073 family)
MRKVFFLIFAILFVFLGSAQAQPSQQSEASLIASLGSADSYRLSPLQAQRESLESFNAESDIYRNNSPVSKMSTGFVNTTTGFVDVPFKIGEESEKSNPLVGWTLGFGEGFVKGVARTGAGIIDMVTFALPPYDEPLIQPEYKVEKPDEGFRINILSW